MAFERCSTCGRPTPGSLSKPGPAYCSAACARAAGAKPEIVRSLEEQGKFRPEN